MISHKYVSSVLKLFWLQKLQSFCEKMNFKLFVTFILIIFVTIAFADEDEGDAGG